MFQQTIARHVKYRSWSVSSSKCMQCHPCLLTFVLFICPVIKCVISTYHNSVVVFRRSSQQSKWCATNAFNVIHRVALAIKNKNEQHIKRYHGALRLTYCCITWKAFNKQLNCVCTLYIMINNHHLPQFCSERTAWFHAKINPDNLTDSWRTGCHRHYAPQGQPKLCWQVKTRAVHLRPRSENIDNCSC